MYFQILKRAPIVIANHIRVKPPFSVIGRRTIRNKKRKAANNAAS